MKHKILLIALLISTFSVIFIKPNVNATTPNKYDSIMYNDPREGALTPQNYDLSDINSIY